MPDTPAPRCRRACGRPAREGGVCEVCAALHAGWNDEPMTPSTVEELAAYYDGLELNRAAARQLW